MKVIKSRRKRIKRLKFVSGVLGLIMFLVVLVRANIVSAGSQDSRLLKNRKEGVYAVTKLNGVDRLFYLNMYTMNGIPAYCIEIGVDITTDVYDSTNNYSGSGLPSIKAEFVQAVSYFGYKYKDHDDYRYYMAAQEIIWEYLMGINVDWTNEESISGNRINIDSYKYAILNLIDIYRVNLNFDFGDKRIIPGEEYIVKEKSGILLNYMMDSVNGMNASIVGNTVHYSVDNANNREVSFSLKWKNYYNYDSKFYSSGNSQKLVSAGNFINKTYSVSFNVVRSNMNVKVVDMDTKLDSPQGSATLEGAKYKLYKGDVEILEFTTDNLGQAYIKDLDSGEYVIKQVSASNGYIINKKDVVVDLKYGENEVILEEKIISNDISIIKYLSNGDNVEEGINFSINDKNGNFIKRVVTNSLGEVSFNLVYGEYIVSQDNTSYGYKVVDDFNIIVDKIVNDSRVYRLSDEEILYDVKINAMDKKNSSKIESEGFCYKIFDKNNSKYIVRDGKDVFCTNKLGEVSVVDFGYGKYSIEEVDVLHGYVLNDEKLDFVVDDSVLGSLISIDFYNDKIIGKVNVLVLKEVFNNNTGDFNYDKVGVSDLELDVYYGNDLINKVTTDKDGKVVLEELELGEYCIIYNGIKKCVDVDTELNNILEVVKDVTIVIELDKGNVILNNVDDYGSVIEGSNFKLYDDNNNLLYNGITNEDGIIKVNKLVVGHYCFVQDKVMYGYFINNDKKCFDVIKDSDVKVKFVNKKNSKKVLMIPNTFVSGGDVFKIIFIVVILILGVFCYKKKVFNI